jgi:hypothetical protein
VLEVLGMERVITRTGGVDSLLVPGGLDLLADCVKECLAIADLSLGRVVVLGWAVWR